LLQSFYTIWLLW